MVLQINLLQRNGIFWDRKRENLTTPKISVKEIYLEWRDTLESTDPKKKWNQKVFAASDIGKALIYGHDPDSISKGGELPRIQHVADVEIVGPFADPVRVDEIVEELKQHWRKTKQPKERVIGAIERKNKGRYGQQEMYAATTYFTNNFYDFLVLEIWTAINKTKVYKQKKRIIERFESVEDMIRQLCSDNAFWSEWNKYSEAIVTAIEKYTDLGKAEQWTRLNLKNNQFK